MRRLSGLILAGAIMLLPAFTQSHGAAYAQDAPPALTFEGDVALWSVAILPDKTADFEQLMSRLGEALRTSEKPERKQQAAGWKLVRSATPMPNGNIVYTHVIDPVVAGADYTIMTILYEANTDPAAQKELYDLYRGAFASNLGISAGRVAVDLSK